MNILYLEPYLAGSHKAFMEGLINHSSHKIISVTLSDKSWKWRMSGGAVSLAQKVKQIDDKVDLIVASSMTNLPAFLALTNPRFASTPTVIYMHENQLTMPLPEGEERDDTYCYINYLSALVANELWFTSEFHLNEFIQAIPPFLEKYSDFKHKELIDEIKQKSKVVYPGLELKIHDKTTVYRKQNEVPVVVWNQRWEYDRDPEKFFRMMNRLDDAGCSFNLILAGDHLQDRPGYFKDIRKRYGNRILHYGYVENPEVYSKLLKTGDIVVSTSRYEFFCTSIMEAIYCGCHPMLPNKLTYPELIPKPLREPLLHGAVFYYSEDDMFKKMQRLLLGEVKPLPEATLKNINRKLDWNLHIHLIDRMLSGVRERFS